MKKLTALLSAVAFSLSLGIAYADDAPPMPEPSKSLTEMIEDSKTGKGGKKGAKKPAAKKQTPKKKAAGKKKNDKAVK